MKNPKSGRAPVRAGAATPATGEAGTGKRRRTRRPAPSAARIRQAFERGTYPYETRLSRRPYEAQKAKLQAELPKLQRWLGETGERIVMLFEGRDAAGKGSTIKRFTEHLNPGDRAKMASWRNDQPALRRSQTPLIRRSQA